VTVDIKTPIGEAIREHELGYDKAEGFHCVSIHCDWHGHDLDFPEHVAEVVVAGLGLREERRTNVMSSGGMMTDSRTGETTSFSDVRYDYRWVTDWKTRLPDGYAW